MCLWAEGALQKSLKSLGVHQGCGMEWGSPHSGDWGKGIVLRCFRPRPLVRQAHSLEWRSFSFQGRVWGEMPLKQERGILGSPLGAWERPHRAPEGSREGTVSLALTLAIVSFPALPAGERGELLFLERFLLLDITQDVGTVSGILGGEIEGRF